MGSPAQVIRMDSKQKGIVIVAVIIVIIAAVFAAQALDDKHNESNDAEVKFLIQDNQGVYFWVSGEGETVYDAWKNAVGTFDLPFVASVDKEGNETGIQSLFGMAMTSDASGGWTWWSQYYYDGSSWQTNTLYMPNMLAKDYSSIAMVYGDGSIMPAVTPSVAVVWDRTITGTLFTIQSPSGLYFRVNGEGTTVHDAWVSAMEAYIIPYESSESSYGKGIQSIFGLAQTEVSPDNWNWWTQDVIGEDGAWTIAGSMMGGIQSADCAQMLLFYGDGSLAADKKAPIFGTD